MLSLLSVIFRRRDRGIPSGTPAPEPLDTALRARDPGQADFIVLAAGLQRLLAKWPADVTAHHFPAARRASRALRVQARLQQELSLPALLLSDLCHEIAVHVDASVRQAAVRCLRHQARVPAGASRFSAAG